jgi:hypothetical protein
MPIYKISFSWYGNGFFLKGRYYYAFIILKMQTYTFRMELYPKVLKF